MIMAQQYEGPNVAGQGGATEIEQKDKEEDPADLPPNLLKITVHEVCERVHTC
jgi:hypothetical protein